MCQFWETFYSAACQFRKNFFTVQRAARTFINKKPSNIFATVNKMSHFCCSVITAFQHMQCSLIIPLHNVAFSVQADIIFYNKCRYSMWKLLLDIKIYNFTWNIPPPPGSGRQTSGAKNNKTVLYNDSFKVLILLHFKTLKIFKGTFVLWP